MDKFNKLAEFKNQILVVIAALLLSALLPTDGSAAKLNWSFETYSHPAVEVMNDEQQQL